MFELASPWILILLPLPFCIWYLLPRTSTQLPTALKVPFFEEVRPIVDHPAHSLFKQRRAGVFVLIWILIIFSLAGPRWVGDPMPVNHEAYNIMLVLDLSGSMQLNDMLLHGRPTSRLSVVKNAAKEFVKKRIGDKIGLIVFGSRAYLQTPLTADRQNVLMRIDDATVGLAGKTTSIGDALGLAVKRMQSAPDKGRVIILLTDGVNNSGVLAPIKAAELAREKNIKVYTIGLGTEAAPRAMNDLLFSMVADLDEKTLRQIAKITGGNYFLATNYASLQHIYSTINQLERTSQEQYTIRPQKDYYPWPLGIALILFLLRLAMDAHLFRRTNFKTHHQEILKV